MAKKERNQEVEFATENEQQFEEEPLFESEAYGTPQAEAGVDVTVTKPVGIGAPVPIVAPRHTTVQLQPIVVPLAVIPYMSQDSDVLYTDGRQQRYAPSTVEYESEPTEFRAVAEQNKKVRKKRKAQPRVFALITLLLSALTVLPFILSYFVQNLGSASIEYFNIIGVIQKWVESGFTRSITYLVYIAVAAIAAVLVISAIIGVIFGKYPRAFNSILAIGTAIGMVAVLIKDLVKHQFVVADKIIFVVVVAITILNAVHAVVFSIVLNRLDDKVERIDREI